MLYSCIIIVYYYTEDLSSLFSFLCVKIYCRLDGLSKMSYRKFAFEDVYRERKEQRKKKDGGTITTISKSMDTQHRQPRVNDPKAHHTSN